MRSSWTAKKSPRPRFDRTVPFVYSIDETLDVGEDRGTPILPEYANNIPFKFNGEIASVAIDLK